MKNAKQIGTMLGRFLEHLEEFGTMSVEEIQWVIQHPKEAIALFVEMIRNRTKVDFLLEPIGTVSIPATTGKFVAKDEFKLKEEGGIFSFFDDDFAKWFLDGDGKIEEPIGEQTLRRAELRKYSIDIPIIAELGGEAKAETTLAEIFALIAKQANGEKGALFNGGWANIFYVRDQKGMLRTVEVRWYGIDWLVNAYSIEDPCGWQAGRQVFSRKPIS